VRIAGIRRLQCTRVGGWSKWGRGGAYELCEVVEVQRGIVGSGCARCPIMVWGPNAPVYGHFDDLTGRNGGVVRIE